MLSNDELAGGMEFILRLWDGAGRPSQWREVLRGDVARRWYTIYRDEDWAALRAEAAGVFRHAVSPDELDRLLRARIRRVYIHTPAVRSDELAPTPAPRLLPPA